MKKIMIAVLALAASTAFADIPSPRATNRATENERWSSEVKTNRIAGGAAKALYESINSPEHRSSSLPSSSTFKVLRAQDGLNQVLCEKRSKDNRVSIECITETSLDGEKLLEYKRQTRMG